MKHDHFLLLRELQKRSHSTQRQIADSLSWSLGKTNSVVHEMAALGFVDSRCSLTNSGVKALLPYKVKNAIILAAGMSTRFAPVSYDVPKALICAKGEILIERIIRQLKEKGIDEIIVVLGYKMEQFLYLKDKFGVKFVVNNEYRIKNTHSSLYAAKGFLSNSYIVCADNYFVENVFEKYEYTAFYGAMYIENKNNERGFILDKNDLIIKTNRPAESQFVMWGHAYFDRNFTKLFIPILDAYYGKQGIENYYWETVYIENLDQLHMYAKKYQNGIIYEFDSIDELKQFDHDFIKNNSVQLINNICTILKCSSEDINILEKLSGGLSNDIFKFECNGNYYVYRYPGDAASIVNEREREYASTMLASKMGIDTTNIFLDRKTGWKLSRFYDTTEYFDPNSDKHIRLLANALRKLHNPRNKKRCGYSFDTFKEALRLKKRILEKDSSLSVFLNEIESKAEKTYKLMKSDNWEVCFSHNDISDSNILINNDNLILIDWEFAGDNDIGFDLAKLFCLTTFDKERMLTNLSYYFERRPNQEEIRHIICCVVINYFYWIVWGIFMNENGFDYLSWTLLWHERFLNYLSLLDNLEENDLWES